jgi:hypothetical protein
VSKREAKVTSNSNTFLNSVQSRLWLFVDTFIVGLLLAALRVSLLLGWQQGSFSFMTVVTTIDLLVTTALLSPIAILLFPLGLETYLPDDYMPKWLVFSTWMFYLVTSLMGIIVSQRGFVLIMYAMLVIVLIFNIAGCGPVVLQALAGRD